MKHSSKNSLSLLHAVVWKRVRLEHHSKDLFCHSYLSPLPVFLNTCDQCFTTGKLSQILRCKAASWWMRQLAWCASLRDFNNDPWPLCVTWRDVTPQRSHSVQSVATRQGERAGNKKTTDDERMVAGGDEGGGTGAAGHLDGRSHVHELRQPAEAILHGRGSPQQRWRPSARGVLPPWQRGRRWWGSQPDGIAPVRIFSFLLFPTLSIFYLLQSPRHWCWYLKCSPFLLVALVIKSHLEGRSY